MMTEPVSLDLWAPIRLKPRIYTLREDGEAHFFEEEAPIWWVRWWDFDEKRWVNCSHWTWKSALGCVKSWYWVNDKVLTNKWEWES